MNLIESKSKEIRDRVEEDSKHPWHEFDQDAKREIAWGDHARQDIPLLLEALEMAIRKISALIPEELEEIEKLFEGK